MPQFKSDNVELNRKKVAELLKQLNEILDKIGLDQQSKDAILKPVFEQCIRNPKLTANFLNLLDKKNHLILQFVHTLTLIAKAKNHTLNTDLTWTLKFLELSEKQLKEVFKKDPELLKKIQKELKNLMEEIKTIVPPEVAKKLENLFTKVNESLKTMEGNLKNNKPLAEENLPDLVLAVNIALHGFNPKQGGYVPPALGVTNPNGIPDDSLQAFDKTLLGFLDSAENNPQLAIIKGAVDTLREVASLLTFVTTLQPAQIVGAVDTTDEVELVNKNEHAHKYRTPFNMEPTDPTKFK